MKLPTPTRSGALLTLTTLLAACSTAPRPQVSTPVATVIAKPVAAVVAPAIPIVHEGENFRYVQRPIGPVDTADSQAPYWLTDFDNSENSRVRVLPDSNSGIALVLQAPVAVPKLLIQEKTDAGDVVHARIVNRAETPIRLEVTCFTRAVPSKRRAEVSNLDVAGRSMVDLALDTPSADRGNLMLRVR